MHGIAPDGARPADLSPFPVNDSPSSAHPGNHSGEDNGGAVSNSGDQDAREVIRSNPVANAKWTSRCEGSLFDVNEEESILLNTPAQLLLEDGRIFEGYSFGAPRSTSGEVVFNTGMVGYPESLSDPSYSGQILTLSFPLVGNYGVADDEVDEDGLPKYFEGTKVHVRALVVADYSHSASHYSSKRTLAQWLRQQDIPGIAGIDTRAVTKHIRRRGAMLGRILIGADVIKAGGVALPLGRQRFCSAEELARQEFDDPNKRHLVGEVSHKTVRIFRSRPFSDVAVAQDPNKTKSEFTILVVDCGMKLNIIRHFIHRSNLKLIIKVVPWDYPFGDEDPNTFDGLFLSNGPGDPISCDVTIQNIRKVMQMGNKPIFGICLGNQLLALAAGADTYKMKFGNRGMNQPVIDMRTTRCYITPQNHGFAVNSSTLPSGWIPHFINANDHSNEGIIHVSRPWQSVQFHPEASGGPTDSWFLFEQFLYQISSRNQSPPVCTIPLSFPCQRIKVLLLGSGGLCIGQAGEFDYSGTQAIKALKEANLSIVLVNANIATVQTSTALADKVYFLPITPFFVEKVIRRERPEGLLCGFGGQTALNCAVELHRRGVLEKYGCRVLGTPIEAIIATEDREVFSQRLTEIGEKTAPSKATLTVEECKAAAKRLGYPVLIRAAFALGGLGSGFAEDEQRLEELCIEAFKNTDQVLVDKSLKGWKEVEYEIVRDCKGNCIAVCNMENFDPLGIHTGDSVVVAPSQTLSNNEFYALREASIKIVRHFGVVGECNVQFAVDPESSEYLVVEVNARLSRSSALASKATGYPLAYVAAKLSIGTDLLQIRNAVTRVTSACFEPALDYVVTKMPRWDLAKFSLVDPRMGSSMKSVGEVMAIGRTFEESFQKALRMVDDTADGFDPNKYNLGRLEDLKMELQNPSPARVWAIAKAFENNLLSIEEVHALTKIDCWFLAKLYRIEYARRKLSRCSLQSMDSKRMCYLKTLGFSDRQIGNIVSPVASMLDVRRHRQALGCFPFVKQIDTLAAEFPAYTNYLYLTYQGCEHDVQPLALVHALRSPSETPNDAEEYRNNARRCSDLIPSPRLGPASPASNSHPSYVHSAAEESRTGDLIRIYNQMKDVLPGTETPLVASMEDFELQNYAMSPNDKMNPNGTSRLPASTSKAYVVLGCGCYRIGSSVEFDWTAMSCVKTLRTLGYKAIVINCNPETVSTDYDESDRLYFETLDLETVMDICEFESPTGVIVSVGGQTPNNLAIGLHNYNVPIVGTSVTSIDQAEDRDKFSQLCDRLRIDQPAWSAFTSHSAAATFATSVGYPVLVRPSYVLSGAAMRVVTASTELKSFLVGAALVSREHPVVISKYIEGAKEVEMDAVAADGDILNYAISEHVENAGVHSGDATLILPAQKLYVETIRLVRKISQKIAKALQISGPFNIQFMCKKNEVKVIECNLRASRTFPFISKTFNLDFIDLATRVMVGAPVRSKPLHLVDLDFVGVKAPVFSFNRLRRADPVLGVEMRSTGEVACFSSSKHEAFLKAMMAAGFTLPVEAVLLCIGPFNAKVDFLPYARTLVQMGFTIYATPGTYDFLLEYDDFIGGRGIGDKPVWHDEEELPGRQKDGSPVGRGLSNRNRMSVLKMRNDSTPKGAATSARHPKLANANSVPSEALKAMPSTEALSVHTPSTPSNSIEKRSPTADSLFFGRLVRVNKSQSATEREGSSNKDQVSAATAVGLIADGKVGLVVNVPGSFEGRALSAGYHIRREAVNCGVPLITDLKSAQLMVDSLQRLRECEEEGRSFWEIRSWDEYLAAPS